MSTTPRLATFKGAFQCPLGSTIVGRHGAPLDDATTTGATLRACADPLVKAGAASVVGLAVAAGI